MDEYWSGGGHRQQSVRLKASPEDTRGEQEAPLAGRQSVEARGDQAVQ